MPSTNQTSFARTMAGDLSAIAAVALFISTIAIWSAILCGA
jgi:hypothetical protein